MEVRRSRTCEKCKNTVPLDRVRLYPRDNERNWLLCDNCCEALRSKGDEKVSNKVKPITNELTAKNLKAAKEPLSSKGAPEGKEQMFCARCKYSFYIDPAKAMVARIYNCPYCGKSDKIYDRRSGRQIVEDPPLNSGMTSLLSGGSVRRGRS